MHLRLLTTLALSLARAAFGSHKCVREDHQHTDPELELSTGASQTRLGVSWSDTPKDEFHGVPSPPLEVFPLVVSGPSTNRVDLVFFSDGYLEEEREKFLADALRLALDVSSNQTFYTVKPLMNFWAAFTPSKESGVGVGGKAKDTPFGLYRPGTELRGVYYAKPKVAGAACASLGEQCDYPILLGNDPLYGGLGGRFTVITPSLANGPLILRHELGHSIIKVGEEYDGGFAYFGVNAHADATKPPSWAHWLSSESPAGLSPRIERSAMPLQAYAWTLLNTSAPWAAVFSSSGAYARHLVRFSLSGVPAAADLRVTLDGADLGWAPRAEIGKDRWHYDVHIDKPLRAGEHTVAFHLLNAEREGKTIDGAQLCSVEIIEFGDESEFISTPGHYGLYPTFSLDNATTYRPTNEDCLMRIVTTPNFCKACLEGLWLALLRDVRLIDALEEECTPEPTLALRLVPLAHLRAAPVPGLDDTYSITWTHDGVAVPAWANQTRVVAPGPGKYDVRVTYNTREVRQDPDDLLSAHAEYTVSPDSCIVQEVI
ncbi:IgA peptidase M64-domain-containing protein [Mycena belliarum]|uniref:IgA peptidase M64-domain-containing protein n=1 Tax=Mycena belliarum TaxID=1033014 RepID=A0AAD6TW08_9AGAR|nr:IgA peptidase M64-domain-containing protein [Mycena belliae]